MGRLADEAGKFSRGVPVTFRTWTSLLLGGGEDTFRSFLAKCQPIKHALEIGTFLGLSAALIAEYAEKVTTVDILTYDDSEFKFRFWRHLGVQDKIDSRIFSRSFDKAFFISNLTPDFVFVDGSHLMESIQFDFSLVYQSPKILMHDYGETGVCGWPDVKEFTDNVVDKGYIGCTYDIEVHEPFALLTRRY